MLIGKQIIRKRPTLEILDILFSIMCSMFEILTKQLKTYNLGEKEHRCLFMLV